MLSRTLEGRPGVLGETYLSFKHNMSYERYLDHLPRYLRRVLTKMRVSDHDLMIERGRRIRPKLPREQRLCSFCPIEIENEQHMLIDCTLYGSRHKLFEKIAGKYPNFSTLNSQQKFIFLMTQEDEQLVLETAVSLNSWLRLRDLLMSYFLG